MHVTNSNVQRWFQSYQHFFFTRGWWVGMVSLVPFIGLLLTPHGSTLRRVCGGSLGFTVGLLFVLAGGYFALIGLSLFYERRPKSLTKALCGLMAGLLFGAFMAMSGVAGFIMALR